MLICEIGQDGKADVVLGKALRVLSETELLKPLRNLLHRGGTPDCRASSVRIGKFIRQTRNAVGSIFLASSRARVLARRQIAVPDRCQLPQPRGRPCARARGRPVPPEAPQRRNAPAASAGATQAGKGQPAGRKAEVKGGDYEPTLAAATKSLGDRVEIRIRDNGTGIPPEVQEKLFNPFFTTKPAGEGTGLGLSISHDIIVKQHGGSIEVDTQPGVFTEFRIVLPRAGASLVKSGERA